MVYGRLVAVLLFALIVLGDVEYSVGELPHGACVQAVTPSQLVQAIDSASEQEQAAVVICLDSTDTGYASPSVVQLASFRILPVPVLLLAIDRTTTQLHEHCHSSSLKAANVFHCWSCDSLCVRTRNLHCRVPLSFVSATTVVQSSVQWNALPFVIGVHVVRILHYTVH